MGSFPGNGPMPSEPPPPPPPRGGPSLPLHYGGPCTAHILIVLPTPQRTSLQATHAKLTSGIRPHAFAGVAVVLNPPTAV